MTDEARKEMLVEVLESEIHDTGSAYACVKKSLLQAVVAELTAKVNGDTSDGYHTFNELYHHRAVLFSVICNTYRDRAWKSLQHHDPSQPMYNGMFIVGIETPEGQATYHYDIDPYWDMFDVRVLDRAPEWDGHTPDEAIRRIGTITPDLVRPRASDEEMKVRMLRGIIPLTSTPPTKTVSKTGS